MTAARRNDRLIEIGLILLAVLSRLPFMSALLYDHDSFLFARAAVHYDLRAGYPHPPGYIFYVYLGRFLTTITGDVNRAFIWLGIIAGALAALCLYHLGRQIFSRAVGFLGALLYLLGPMIWFYHEIALTYAVEGFVSALVALIAWRSYQGSRRAALLLSVVLGVAGGIRPWLIPELFILWLAAVWRLGTKHLIVGFMLILLASLSWLVPNFVSAGGIGSYISLVSNYGGGLFHEGHFGKLAGTIHAFSLMATWWYYALGAALIGLLWLGLRGWIWRKPPVLIAEPGARWGRFFAAWILPSFLLRLFFHLTSPGYLLVFLPGLCILAAAGLFLLAQDLARALRAVLPHESMLRGLRRGEVVLAIISIGILGHHIGTFLTADQGFSWPVIQIKNLLYRNRLDFVRKFPADQTVVFASDMANVAHYYLEPQYRVINVFITPGERVLGPQRPEQDRARYIVLFDDQLSQADQSPEMVKEEPLPIGIPGRYYELGDNQEMQRRPGEFRVVGK
jgi:hypothetical protein